MPAKNIVKEYRDEAYYHLYNRGVAKQPIFLDDQDYKTFLSYLKIYLSPFETNLKIAPSKKLKNYTDEITLLAYCLMPNHFHLFVWQKNARIIANFMRSLGTKYSTYFNKKYHRVGPVFQGNYKAVIVQSENQFLYLSKYIHRNPFPDHPARSNLAGYKYSSYQNYLNLFNQNWVKTEEILSYFNKISPAESYQKFVEETDESDLLRLKNLTLDIDE
ncbi:MAG: transposase [Patescibacteria group bacterium]